MKKKSRRRAKSKDRVKSRRQGNNRQEQSAQAVAAPPPKSASPLRRLGPGALVLLALVVVVAVVFDMRSRLPESDRSGEDPESSAPALSASSEGADSPGTTATSSDSAVATVTGADVQQTWEQLDDPAQDGWETEAFNNQAGAQFKAIGKLLAHPDDLISAEMSVLAADAFVGGSLVPRELEVVFRDDTWQVERLLADTAAEDEQPVDYSGPAGLRELLADLAGRFEGAEDFRTKFKIFRVEEEGDQVSTRQYVEIAGSLPEGVLEQHATWEARWLRRRGVPPLLLGLEVVDFEQVQSTQPGGPLLVDCTSSILAHNDCYGGQVLRGFNHWLWRTQNTRYFFLLSTPGMAVGDVNNDGLDDLFVCQEQGLPNLLFLQRPDGTADEVAALWGVDWLEDARSALLVDFDNDGDQDLAVGFLGGVLLASNESGEGFRLRTVLPTTEDVMSLAAADYDEDGDVDIYICAYYADQIAEESQGGSIPAAANRFVYHNATNGGRNILWQNDVAGDDWSFHDATEEVGMDADNSRFSFAASWDDYDNDDDIDLYVANDYGQDNLYRNDGGSFVDISLEANVENSASGMSAAWGDYDRDGWMDVYLGNMWSSAGNRITFQPQFKTDAPTVRDRLQRFARGNTLLRNRGDGGFEDVSAPAGVEMGRWAWCSQFADINNDGWEDILVTNGYITGSGSGDL